MIRHGNHEYVFRHHIFDKLEALKGVVEEIQELDDEERKFRIAKLKELAPETIESLLDLRGDIQELLLNPQPIEDIERLENFEELMVLIFDKEEEKEINQDPEEEVSSVPDNLSLYPDVQAQIRFKIK